MQATPVDGWTDYWKRKFYNIVPSDFLNIWTLISWRRLMIGIRFFYEILSRLNWISLGVIKSENCRTSFFGDRREWNKLSRDLVRFLEMTPGRTIFFDQSMFDIQWENKGYSICQIVLNNDVPKIYS